MPEISLDSDVLQNTSDALRTEWILTNSIGGYASSTVLGLNTRKYHGLLVVAFRPPLDRRMCLARLDEEIHKDNDIYPLGANEFREGIFPKGYAFLRGFSVSPFPEYIYEVNDVEVRKRIFMPTLKNTVVVMYTILNRSSYDIKARIFPIVNWRNFHSVTNRWKVAWDYVHKKTEDEISVTLGIGHSKLLISATVEAEYVPTGRWIERVFYREEFARGESFLDDYYQLGYFETSVDRGNKLKFAINTTVHTEEESGQKHIVAVPNTTHDIETLFERESLSRRSIPERVREEQGLEIEDDLSWPFLATKMFVVRGKEYLGRAVIAGYHWFGAWGRDTFISLPGLLLTTGRFQDAREVFTAFLDHFKRGLIPNFFSEEGGQTSYNSVDATLWFVNAAFQYLKYTADFRFVKESLWMILKKVVETYLYGTDFGIRVDNDGLLLHGPQLTWMDAAVDDRPATPRAGKAVEVQALWFNTLRIMETLASKFKEDGKKQEYARLAKTMRRNFLEQFWNPKMGCLSDVVDRSGKNDSMRPNQIIAVSLDYSMLEKSLKERVVDLVHRKLFTPYGLRTLSRDSTHYAGTCKGDRRSRDMAYHNGTVWPWLLGPFTTAFLKTKGYAKYTRDYARKNLLSPFFRDGIRSGALGSLNEIYDGDPPHTPRGCIAQAWSVAEPLRAYIEDVSYIRPKHENVALQTPE